MRKVALFILTLFPFTCWGSESEAISDASEEALFARRIAEFWRDKDAPLTKSQIDHFLQQYPLSPYKDSLLALLGEIYSEEKNWGKALLCYNQISSSEQKEKSAGNRLECLYRLGMVDELKRELSAQIPPGEKPITHKDKALKAFLYGELLLREAGEEAKNNPQEALKKKEQARLLYSRLLKSEHKGQALLALGDIAFQNEAFVEAAKWYRNAADAVPDKQEELLLLTAQLLYQEGQYKELIDQREFFRAKLKTKADILLGKSYFATGQNSEALLLLLPFLPEGDKQILLTLLSAAYQVEDFNLVDQVAKQFVTYHSGDETLPKVLYMQALALQRQQKLDGAQALYLKLQNEYPAYDKHEEIAYELALVLFEQKKWDESHAEFTKFVEKYPNSLWVPYAAYYLTDAAFQGENAFGELFNDIDRFLQISESNQEKALTLAKVAFGLYDRKKFPESKNVAQKILGLNPSSQLQAQVHFLLAACALENGKEEDLFVQHAEKVLELRPDFPEKMRLREKLINSYLQNKNKEAAARHLYSVLEEKGELSQERILWLANYFYEKAQGQIPESFYGTVEGSELLKGISKGIIAFEAVLGSDPVIHPENLFLEQEYFKLSNLYAWRGQHEAQVVLLQNLHEQHRKNPEWKWTLPTKTLTALAEGYRHLGEEDKALAAYAEIMKSRNSDTASSYRAKLEWVRLQRNRKLALEDPLTVELLKNLKDLQIKKNMKYEPLHLEAALDYARLRADLEPPEKQEEHHYFLLQRVKEDFTEKRDLISKEYHAEREKSPAQNQIYQAYMLLIDAQLFSFEGKSDTLKRETAASLFESLLNGKFAVSKYLIDQAQSGLSALN